VIIPAEKPHIFPDQRGRTGPRWRSAGGTICPVESLTTVRDESIKDVILSLQVFDIQAAHP
jgi:hypothetical protein